MLVLPTPLFCAWTETACILVYKCTSAAAGPVRRGDRTGRWVAGLAWPASLYTTGDVAASVEQLAHEASPEVVRRDGRDAGLTPAALQAESQGPSGQAPVGLHASGLRDAAVERPRLGSRIASQSPTAWRPPAARPPLPVSLPWRRWPNRSRSRCRQRRQRRPRLSRACSHRAVPGHNPRARRGAVGGRRRSRRSRPAGEGDRPEMKQHELKSSRPRPGRGSRSGPTRAGQPAAHPRPGS